MRRHLSFANIASALALSIALTTGGAYAATHLGRNSVGTEQLKNSSVTTGKVKDHSLTAKDLAAGTVPKTPDTVPSGKTILGIFNYDSTTDVKDIDDYVDVDFPMPAASAPTEVAFAPDSGLGTTNPNAECSGTVAAPTAPPGEVCLYADESSGNLTVQASTFGTSPVARLGFDFHIAATVDNANVYIDGVWAYTAP